MADKKIIAVVGATGAQGGGMVRALLDDGTFAVRALTRDVNSDSARELAARGVEVVEADLFKEASVVKAFSGAYGAFAVTPFWAHMSVEKEAVQAKAIADAARITGLKHVVWSTLEDTRAAIAPDDDRMPMIDEYRVPHFDGKAEDDVFFEGVPTTYLQTTFYWNNLPASAPTRDDDGELAITTLPMGDSRIAGIAVEDIGRIALGIFHRPEEFINKTIGVAGEFLTGNEIAEIFTRVLGEKVNYRPPTHDAFRGLGFPAAVESGNMYQYYAEFGDAFLGRRDLDLARNLHPGLQTFEHWLENNKRQADRQSANA